MTYLHALQYLEGISSTESKQSAKGSRKEERPNITEAYAAALGRLESNFFYLLFPSDRMGLVCAELCRNALMAEGLHVGEIADPSIGPLDRVLRLDGAPVPPPILREICHTARATEQKLLREATKKMLREKEDPSSFSIAAPDAADRCGVVFSRLFADAGCHVVLLIGDIHHPRLRDLAHCAPERCVAILNASQYKPLSHFPKGTQEVICPTCEPAMFRKVTDACSREGSRLSLPTTANLTVHSASPFSARISYRTLTDCSLQNGSSTVTLCAMLCYEALAALTRRGFRPLTDQAVRTGFFRVTPPLFFSPLSIEPLVITHAVTDDDDIDALLAAVAEFDGTLPRTRYVWCTTALPSGARSRLAALGTLCDVQNAEAMLPLPPEAAGAMHVLVGDPDSLSDIITQRNHSLRAL
jgi:hypothetical protein